MCSDNLQEHLKIWDRSKPNLYVHCLPRALWFSLTTDPSKHPLAIQSGTYAAATYINQVHGILPNGMILQAE